MNNILSHLASAVKIIMQYIDFFILYDSKNISNLFEERTGNFDKKTCFTSKKLPIFIYSETLTNVVIGKTLILL